MTTPNATDVKDEVEHIEAATLETIHAQLNKLDARISRVETLALEIAEHAQPLIDAISRHPMFRMFVGKVEK